jgi:hypothetical protein
MDPSSVLRRVQFAVLLQFVSNGLANRGTTAAMVPGTDARDLAAALEHLVVDGSIEGPIWKLSSLLALTENGEMALTDRGQTRVDEDDV